MNILFLLQNKTSVCYLEDDCTVRCGLEKMRAHGYSAIPVITKDGDYCGCVSEGDFLWHIIDYQNNSIRDKENVLIRDIIRVGWNPAVRVEAQIEELLERAVNQNFIPVVDDRNKFIGIITRKDIFKYMIRAYQKQKVR